jgi:hypothetical protein
VTTVALQVAVKVAELEGGQSTVKSYIYTCTCSVAAVEPDSLLVSILYNGFVFLFVNQSSVE